MVALISFRVPRLTRGFIRSLKWRACLQATLVRFTPLCIVRSSPRMKRRVIIYNDSCLVADVLQLSFFSLFLNFGIWQHNIEISKDNFEYCFPTTKPVFTWIKFYSLTWCQTAKSLAFSLSLGSTSITSAKSTAQYAPNPTPENTRKFTYSVKYTQSLQQHQDLCEGWGCWQSATNFCPSGFELFFCFVVVDDVVAFRCGLRGSFNWTVITK